MLQTLEMANRLCNRHCGLIILNILHILVNILINFQNLKYQSTVIYQPLPFKNITKNILE